MENEKNNNLFDPEVKNAYLNSLNEDTAKNYLRILTITAEFEKKLNKDINSFSLEELEEVLISFGTTSRNTVESYGRIISGYINWCVKQGIVSVNPLSELKPDDFARYTVQAEYLTEKQMRRYEEQCANYQDAVILRLIFSGLSGRQYSEISNLKTKDVDFESNTLHLTNALQIDQDGFPSKFTERFIKVDDRTTHLIKGAIEQKTYLKRNGFMIENNHLRDFTDLVKNDYVVRASITKNGELLNAPLDKFVIYRRIQTIAETLGIDGLNAKLIQRSGMLHMANDLVGESDEVTIDDLKIIADRFNLKSYHNLKGIITMKNLRRIYPK